MEIHSLLFHLITNKQADKNTKKPNHAGSSGIWLCNKRRLWTWVIFAKKEEWVFAEPQASGSLSILLPNPFGWWWKATPGWRTTGESPKSYPMVHGLGLAQTGMRRNQAGKKCFSSKGCSQEPAAVSWLLKVVEQQQCIPGDCSTGLRAEASCLNILCGLTVSWLIEFSQILGLRWISFTFKSWLGQHQWRNLDVTCNRIKSPGTLQICNFLEKTNKTCFPQK